MKCSECNKRIKDDAKICPHCGSTTDAMLSGEILKADANKAYTIGIIGLIFCWCLFGLVCGPIAIVKGSYGLKHYDDNIKSTARKGLIFGIVSLAVIPFVLSFILGFVLVFIELA